ncbi:MAG TPA: bidirectional hydrogenase complex protein HoxU [Kineosporiaceae bacterium]
MRKRRPTIELTVDGQSIKAHEGETVLQVARRNEIRIPSLCYLEGLSTWGACRLCVVEVSGSRGLSPACATLVQEDMVVATDTPRLRQHRRMLLELMFAEGNHVCAVCVANGHCDLQDTAVDAGMDHVRLDYQAPARTVDASHPRFVYDPNRCIMCTLCVRTCDEIEGAHIWDIASRGRDAFPVTGLGKPWGDSHSCTQCGKCVWVCPTGALSQRGAPVREPRGNASVISWLVSARRDQEWLPAEEDEG